VAYANHGDALGSIVDLIDNPVIAYPYAPAFQSAFQLTRPGRTRIIPESKNMPANALKQRPGQAA
jgi:hypothetical protein